MAYRIDRAHQIYVRKQRTSFRRSIAPSGYTNSHINSNCTLSGFRSMFSKASKSAYQLEMLLRKQRIMEQQRNAKSLRTDKIKKMLNNKLDKNYAYDIASNIVSKYSEEQIRHMKIKKHVRMVISAILLSDTNSGGFNWKGLKDKYIQLFGRETNIWTDDVSTDNYDWDASFRSLMYEMSPSSCQHWFKYGIMYKLGLPCPFYFVNRELALQNEAQLWMKVNGAKTGRGTRGNKWRFVPKMMGKPWNETEWGPLPSDDILIDAKVGRLIGNRGGLGRRGNTIFEAARE